MDMITVTTDDGTRLHVEAAPDDGKPPLVFSNSLGTDLHLWDGQVATLTGRFRIVRYDSRGHGRSDAPAGDYTVDRLGRDLLAILDALSLDRVAFCGLSLGGMMGQWLGVNAPDRVARLVLSNTSARMAPPEMWQQRIATVMASGMAPLAAASVERWFTPAFRDRPNDAVDRIRDMLLATPAAGYAGSCAAIRDMDQRETIRAIAAPTLIIAGAADPATPPDHARQMHGAIAGSRLEIIADAAHLSNIEQPAVFNRLLTEFLCN